MNDFKEKKTVLDAYSNTSSKKIEPEIYLESWALFKYPPQS